MMGFFRAGGGILTWVLASLATIMIVIAILMIRKIWIR
jgi:hypothetical protein